MLEAWIRCRLLIRLVAMTIEKFVDGFKPSRCSLSIPVVGDHICINWPNYFFQFENQFAQLMLGQQQIGPRDGQFQRICSSLAKPKSASATAPADAFRLEVLEDLP